MQVSTATCERSPPAAFGVEFLLVRTIRSIVFIVGSLKVGDNGLTVGDASFSSDEIDRVRAVIRLYEYPPTRSERVRERLSDFCSVALEPVVLLLFSVLVIAMVGALFLALGDSLGFTPWQAAPVGIPVVLLALAAAWRVGQVIAADVSRAGTSLFAVPRSSFRFHVLMVDAGEVSTPVLASADFRAVDDLRQRITDHLESSSAVEPFETDLESPEGKWILAEQMVVDGDRIDFPQSQSQS